MAVNPNIPTLEELIERLKSNDNPVGNAACRKIYNDVASRNRNPLTTPLPANLQILACQAMVVLLNHIQKE